MLTKALTRQFTVRGSRFKVPVKCNEDYDSSPDLFRGLGFKLGIHEQMNTLISKVAVEITLQTGSSLQICDNSWLSAASGSSEEDPEVHQAYSHLISKE